ncbi:MAG: UPF0158 family protein [Marmoricola sp.]
MADVEDRRLLRSAVARGDGAEVGARLRSRPWPEELQLIGDGLLFALDQGVQDASAQANECVAALRQRGWTGDEGLADALQARLGDAGTVRLLRPLAVDLEELAMVLEGDPVYGGGRIDLETGEVWPQPAIDYAEETGELDETEDDSDRWLRVKREGSGAGYRDMERFISQIDDPELADRLSKAISGRGAFRRFKDVLSRWPDLVGRWQGFTEDRHRGRARAWLADQGYAAVPRALPKP